MKLIVGLGNPGDKYAATRHNAGFWLVERLAAQSGTTLRNDGKFQALVGRHDASGAWLVLPQSFMNSSGRPVQMMASFFKIEPAEVLVIHDELDLPPGTARLKQGGGVAGHNGLKDISARLASHDYWRLRLGIGRPPERGATVDYVLHKPAQDERAAIDEAIARSLEVLPLMLSGDTQEAMLKLHTREAEQKEKPAEAQKPQEASQKRPARDRVHAASSLETAETAPHPATGTQGAPAEAHIRRASIERFGDVAETARLQEAESAAKNAVAGETEREAAAAGSDAPGGTQASAKTGKKGGLNSLLKKIIPGAGDRKK